MCSSVPTTAACSRACFNQLLETVTAHERRSCAAGGFAASLTPSPVVLLAQPLIGGICNLPTPAVNEEEKRDAAVSLGSECREINGGGGGGVGAGSRPSELLACAHITSSLN